MVLRIGVLASGRGSNLESILKSIERGYVKGAKVAVVVSDKPEARALEVSLRHQVAAVCVPPAVARREEYDAKIAAVLSDHGVKPGEGLVLLAGYMRILSRYFVELYRDRIMNIHPALLPAFPGQRAQKQALEHGVKVSGCTVHFVTPEVDAGPIILQKAVEVKEGDDEDRLSSRILRQEHRIYPRAVKYFAEGRLRVEGRRVLVRA